MEELDKETQDALNRSEKLSVFAQSEDWKYVRGILEDRMRNFALLEDKNTGKMSDEEIGREMKARKFAVSIIKDWMSEIDSQPEEYKEFKKSLKGETKDNIIYKE